MATPADVGIQAKRSGRGTPDTGGFLGEQFQFRLGLHIKEKNSSTEGFANFLARFSNSGKHDAPPGNTNLKQAIQFSAGDNIETATRASKQPKQRKIGIGLYGITDGVRNSAKGMAKAAECREDTGAAIDIDWS